MKATAGDTHLEVKTLLPPRQLLHALLQVQEISIAGVKAEDVLKLKEPGLV